MKHKGIEGPGKPSQTNFDFRTEEEVRKAMVDKVQAGEEGKLDPRERAMHKKQRKDEWRDDQPRYED